ncbi:protein LONG AFTER FAR-RED 3-like [Patiria miniata]|uniref:Amidohydrolase 3 domain-containing protein n=1 Tax=Patiria miniata TaxID=46514 RepID=A0A914AVZ2_PATMI|nr:protein LONG AFTER FAR-RED 3-like [Patiria miniata]
MERRGPALLLQLWCVVVLSLSMVLSRKADIILFGGDIITMEDGDLSRDRGKARPLEAVAIAGETIQAVGTLDEVFCHAGSKTQTVYLNQQTLMPGFIEPHTHPTVGAQIREQYITIGAATFSSYEEIRSVMVNRINELAATPNSNGWGAFFGWDPELISDLPALNADVLDGFSDTIPIFVWGQNGHIAWVNHAALRAANITNTTENPIGGTFVKDQDNNPTGKLLELGAIGAVQRVMPPLEPHAFARSLEDLWRIYASAGFTTVADLLYRPNAGLDEALRRSTDAENFPLRLALFRFKQAVRDVDCTDCAAGDAGGIGEYSSRLWEAGIKLIADGSPHSGTSAIREPYLYTPLTETLGFPDPPGYGILNFDTRTLFETVRRYHRQGKKVSIHAHGERANDQVLNVHEQVLAELPNQDNRHRLEHVGLMTEEQIERAGKLNVTLSFFVDHLRFYAKVYKTNIFGDRVNRWTPLSVATKNNITWTIHQDHPAFPGDPSPFANMKTAITRCTRDDPTTPYGPEYRVSIHEALKAYTVNAAWQLHLEDKVGSIQVGKKADLVVLSENPYRVDPFDLERIRVVETFVDGRRNKLARLKTVRGIGTDLHVLESP